MRERRLRSREATDLEKPLFEYDLDAVDINKQLTVHSAPKPLLCRARALVEEHKPSAAAESEKKNKAVENGHKKKECHESGQDPLDFTLFQGHHRRMEREERRMLAQDRLQLTIDQSRVLTQRKLLLGPEWRVDIPHIVRINDSDNYNAILTKRNLALEEIDEFLRKYDEYRRRLRPRDSEKARAERNAKKRKTNSGKARTNIPTHGSPESEPEPEPPVYCEIRPCAFGYMMPSSVFPPREFTIPRLWITEVETLRLLEDFQWVKSNETQPNVDHDNDHMKDERLCKKNNHKSAQKKKH